VSKGGAVTPVAAFLFWRLDVIIICGEKALDPVDVSRVCNENPHNEVYCLPWVTTGETFEANLRSNGGRPNRFFPCQENREELNAPFIELAGELPGDPFGRMADILSDGMPVVNQVMSCPCLSGFYGNVLVPKAGASWYIVALDDVQRYFPFVPLSSKIYAATTVPVQMEGTDEFAEIAGRKSAPVLVATDFIPGIIPFMGFLKVMTGRGVIGVFRPKETIPQKSIPLLRYNRGYRLGAKDYERMFL